MLSDDDQPLVSMSKVTHDGDHVVNKENGLLNGKTDDYSMSEEDTPLSQSTHNRTELPTSRARPPKRKQPVFTESSSDDETPLASSPVKSAPSSVVPIITDKKPATGAVNGNGRSKGNVKNDGDRGVNHSDKSKKQHVSRTKEKKGAPPKKKAKKDNDSSSSGPDGNSSVIVEAKPKQTRKKRRPKAESDADEAMSEDDKPVITKPSVKKAAKKASKTEEMSGAETTKPKKGTGKTPKEESSSPRKGKSKKTEDEEEEEVFKWWEAGDPNEDGSIKWQTLEHHGVIFPPPYEPLPPNVKMKYNAKTVDLPPASEEVAGFYGAMLETDHAQDATFNKNFFEDWKIVLKQHPPRNGIKITSFDLCDFRPLYEYFEAEKARKKALSAAEKKELKRAKDALELKYTTCLLDGRKEKVGNFRVEPPGLFRGRGDHPKKGALKFRVRPEDITLNIGQGAPTPVPNMQGNWKHIQHDQTVTWLATWTENVNGNHKYVFLAAGSSLKGQSDMLKFEKARELKSYVERIRQDYNEELKSKVMADRQRATAMYFIDKLALRAGNEKGEDEADTVGCCSLRCEHVTLEAPNFIIFDFLGKDSIRYYNRVAVEPQIFKNIRIFKENKNDDDNLFDRVNTTTLNKHLASYMKGLTAKVFRTYNASITFQEQLDNKSLENATVQEKLNAYNHANRMVAILCNHQRSVPKTHEQSMEKMRYRLLGLKYERMKFRHVLFGVDSKFKQRKKYSQDESDLDDEWIESHEDQLKAKDIEKAEKKFAKDNEKLVEEGKSPQKDSVLQDKIADIEAEYERLAEERGTGKATLKRERATEKIEQAIDKLEERIKTFKLQMDDRDAGKEVALGTSKINYLDPRITAAWCKIHDVPIEKIFSKTLVVKFPWAMEVDSDWKF